MVVATGAAVVIVATGGAAAAAGAAAGIAGGGTSAVTGASLGATVAASTSAGAIAGTTAGAGAATAAGTAFGVGSAATSAAVGAAAGGTSAAATGGTFLGIASGPVGWIALGADETWECWRPVLRDYATEKNAPLLKDVLRDPRLNKVNVFMAKSHPDHVHHLTVKNKWNDVFRINFMRFEDGKLAAHAEKIME